MHTNRSSASGQRRVPLTLCLQALFGRMSGTIGWLVAGFSLIGFWCVIPHLHDGKFLWPILLISFFVAVGLLLIILALHRGQRSIRALRHGVPVAGTLISVISTGSYNGFNRNGELIYRMTFEFTTDTAQRHTVSCETDAMKTAWLRFYNNAYLLGSADAAAKAEKNPDDLREVVLYDPADPTIALVPVDIGPTLRADMQGQILGLNPWHGIIACIAPLLVILGHGWYLSHWLVPNFSLWQR